MKAFTKLAALSFVLSSLAACGEGKVEAADIGGAAKETMAKVKDVDLSSLSTEALQEKADELVDQLQAKLAEIKDSETAANVSATLEPVAEKLAEAKRILGEKMPDMAQIRTAVEDLKARFANDPAVMEKLQPLIEKLQSLFS